MRTWLSILVATLLGVACQTIAQSAPQWGRLANPGFVNHRIKATYFFTGQALDGSNYYQTQPLPMCNAPNCCSSNCPNPTYSLHPVDQVHLKWSQNVANQTFALDEMVRVGLNVIHMSSWGDDVSNAWVTGAAPMQTSPKSHDELFDAIAARPLLVVPFLEERGGTNPWSFKDEFPTTVDGHLAPGTINQIEYLVKHYLQDPAHPDWSNHWARVYDRKGQARYAVGIIHAASNRPSGGDDNLAFAYGLDAIAAKVCSNVNVKVGFFLDALPFGTYADAKYYPSASGTGAWLATNDSTLAIACFAPEVYLHSGDTAGVLAWKRNWSQGWAQSGVPFLMDVSSGYDGRVVFGVDWYYGLDQPALWLCGLDQMVRDFGQSSGIVFNSWNGYTEGMVAVPTTEQGDFFYSWLRALLAADVYARKPDVPAPRNGTWCSPYTLLEAVQNVSSGGTVGLLPTPITPFDAPIIISKPCTITAIKGTATVGR